MNVIGIDEAGRGPLAGPVYVGCVALHDVAVVRAIFPRVRDSKQLSETVREEWFASIRALQRDGALAYVAVSASAPAIDRNGIVPAIAGCVTRALKKIGARHNAKILLDGTLHAPHIYKNQKTIIKGDEKELAIALASVVAKVLRDRYMLRMDTYYPAYGFKSHKGYGTKTHTNVLKKHGLSPIHRATFCRRFQ